MKQSEILTIMAFKSSEKKYKKSALTLEMSDRIYQNLLQLMNSEKIFSDSNLSLPKLVKKMTIPQHHVSQVINVKFNQSFFNLISMFRIEEAKNLLTISINNKMNIAQIAAEVGFNSISAFNAAFRKFTGLNPLQFKNQIINGE